MEHSSRSMTNQGISLFRSRDYIKMGSSEVFPLLGACKSWQKIKNLPIKWTLLASRLWRKRMKPWTPILIFSRGPFRRFLPGTRLGERLKDQGVQNINTVHELVKRLSQAKDFEEALRIQTEFMQSQLNAFKEHAISLAEAYTE